MFDFAVSAARPAIGFWLNNEACAKLKITPLLRRTA